MKKTKSKSTSKVKWIIGIVIIAILIGSAVLFLIPGVSIFSKKIKIGYNQYAYPPFQYTDDYGQLVGFDIDLATEVMQDAGKKFKFVAIDWTKKADALESGQVDVLWGGLEMGSIDKQKFKFTSPLLKSGIVLLMDTGSNYKKMEDLKNKAVCALDFTPGSTYFQAYDRDVIQSRDPKTLAEYRSVIDLLKNGKSDCLIADTAFASFVKKTDPAKYKISQPLIDINFAAAVRESDTELFDNLQKSIDRLQGNGKLEELRKKWVD